MSALGKRPGNRNQGNPANAYNPQYGALGRTPQNRAQLTQGFQQNTMAGNAMMQQLMQQMQQQQPMNTDFGAQRQAANDAVMNQFNQQMNPQFQQEQTDFRQRMAEQGIDPNSEGAQKQYAQMMQAQNNQRQTAMNSAQQAGLAEQQQGFNQASIQQQLPYQQMQSLLPMYGYQNQGYQSAMDRRNQLAMIQAQNQGQMNLLNQKIRAGGGADPQADFLNKIILAGIQGGSGYNPNNASNSAVNGAAQGAGAAIMGGLLK